MIFWGTFFPLISEAVTGTEASVGPPWFNRYTMPLALVLVLLSGIGPMIAWRRVTPSALRRVFAVPLAVAARGARRAARAHRRRPRAPPSLVMFTLIAFVLAVVGQEFWRGARGAPRDDRRALAARARAAGRPQPAPLRRLHRARRASRCCSSAWPRRRRSSTSATCGSRPGQSTEVGDYKVTYREPTAALGDDRAGTGAPITLGAVLDVRRGRRALHAAPVAQLLPDAATPSRGRSGASSRASRPARWTCAGACAATSGWRCSPTCARSTAPIAEADRSSPTSPGDVRRSIIAALVERYRSDPPPAASGRSSRRWWSWIWIGGGDRGARRAAGAVARRRRRAAPRARASTRRALGRELSRA